MVSKLSPETLWSLKNKTNLIKLYEQPISVVFSMFIVPEAQRITILS